MKKQQLLNSLVGLLLGFFMLASGAFFFLTRYVLSFELALRSLVLNHLHALSNSGLIVFFCGCLFLFLLARLNRRTYLLLKMGGVSVEDRLIAHFAQKNLQKFFPDQLVECEVVARAKGKIEILANLPYLANHKKEHILTEIERVLVSTLRKQCQYEKDFLFNVSFSTATSEDHLSLSSDNV